MEERVGLVFSWDPRTRVWVKERGPDDSVPPAVSPIDVGAVQTYFLDPSNGKWHGTILGLKARQISVELKDLYRAPAVSGLALPRTNEPAQPEPRHSRAPLLAGLVALVLLIGGGAFAAQAMLGSGSPTALGSPTPAASVTSAPSVAPSATATAQAPAAPTAAGGGTSGGAPVRTPAPTPPPTPQTLRLSVRLPNGTQVFYSGPAAINQGATATGIFSVLLPTGQGGNDSLTIYFGEPGNPAASTTIQGARPDPNGNYVVTLRSTIPRGDQKLSVIYGQTPGIFTLGTITVR